MQDDGYIPPMTPEDLAVVMNFAGPLYQESRLIESFTSDNPIPNTYDDNFGSRAIKNGLERAQHLAQASMHRQMQQQMYVAPAPPIYTEPVQPTHQQIPIPYTSPEQVIHPVPMPSGNQMEFNFNPSTQDATNDLLKEISKKLTKIVDLLEKKEEEPVKIPKSRRKPKAITTNVQNQV